MSKVKILMVGPTKCGKTVLCNFLAEATEVSGGEYRPTQGVRILEFEAAGLNLRGRSSVDVELWDCSGDKKFEACWPAIARDAMGVIFVYNPDQHNHDDDLDAWYRFLVEQQNIKVQNCMVMAHHRPQANNAVNSDLSANFSKMQTTISNIEEDPDAVRSTFNTFLEHIVIAMSNSREQEELNIMNSR
ncbi:intraflagellar transport protein 22 homolog [Pomacea canaliculata]|uniref:intraflagellar transport protein 22 homolog n=1 Tax=Pomacea canaliculata TaxID=400727 RepID=UPI000D73D6E5|nr:intraflagellar transport protein 22 homolog [Pomacea canaliculata]